MKNFKGNRKITAYILLILFTIFSLFQGNGLAFDVANTTVVEGNVTIDTADPNNINITNNAASSIIDIAGGGFDIGNGQTINVNQLMGQQLLIRDISGNVTEIAGTLNVLAGLLVLVNTFGIHVDSTGVINIAAGADLIASTLNIQNQLFMNNNLTFEQLNGTDFAKIINDGEITAAGMARIALLSDAIENHGTIEVQSGQMVLAGVERATVDLSGSGLINLVVDKGVTDNQGQPVITNTGELHAEDGKITLTAEMLNNTLNTLINSTGIIEAGTAAIGEEGTVEIRANGAVDIAEILEAMDVTVEALGESQMGNIYAGNLTLSTAAAGIKAVYDVKANSFIDLTGNLHIDMDTTLGMNSSTLSFDDPTAISNEGTFELKGDETLINFINDTDSGLVLYSGNGNYTNRILPTGTDYYDLAFIGDGFHRLGNLNYHVRNDLRVESNAPRLPDSACTTPPCFDYSKFNVDARNAQLLDVDGSYIQEGGHYRAPRTRTTIAGDFDFRGGYYDRNDISGSTVEFDGTGDQSMYLLGGATPNGYEGHGVFFENLVYSGDGTLRTVYRSGNTNFGLRVNQDFTINGGGTYLTNNSFTRVQGGLTVTNGSAFDAASIDQAGREQIFRGRGGKGILVEEGSSFIGGKGNVTVDDRFNQGTYVRVQSGGTFAASKNDTTVRGDFVIETDSVKGDGTFAHNDGTVIFDANSAVRTTELVTGGDAFNNLLINDRGLRKVEVDDVHVLSSFHKGDIGTYDANGHETVVQGANGGTALMIAGNYLAGEGKQTFDADFTISGGTYYSESGLTEVNGNLSVTNTGRLNGGTGDIDVNGNMLISGNAVVTGTSGDFSVEGNWTNTGTYNHNNGHVVMDGSLNAELDNGSDAFHNLTLAKSDMANTVQLRNNLNVENVMTMQEGTFEQNEHTVTVGPAGDNANIGRETFNMNGGIFNGSNDGAEIDINGDYRQTGGDFRATSGDMYVSGNFERADGGEATINNPYDNPADPNSPAQITIKTSAGNFDANTGTFILNAKDPNASTNQTLTGSTKFYHFTKETDSSDYLTFESRSLTEVEGRTTLRGSGSSPDELLYIRSTDRDEPVYIAPAYDPEGNRDRNISSVDVQDNHNLIQPVIFPADQDVIDHNAVDSGDTTNWFPAPLPPDPDPTPDPDPNPDPDPDPNPEQIPDPNVDSQLVQNITPEETTMVCESVMKYQKEVEIDEAEVYMVHPDGSTELLGKGREEIETLRKNLNVDQQAEVREINPDHFVRCLQIRQDQEITSESNLEA